MDEKSSEKFLFPRKNSIWAKNNISFAGFLSIQVVFNIMNWLKTAITDKEFEYLEQIKDICIQKNGRLPRRGEKLPVFNGEDIFEGRRVKYKLYLKFDGYRFETDRYYDF